MTAFDSSWLEARVAADDAARERSLSLLEQCASALRPGAGIPPGPLTVVDLGAGTGKSALWFDRHLRPRLLGRELRWILLDAHRPSLELAEQAVPQAHTITAPISRLPEVLAEHLPAEPAPGELLLTGSALLDVLVQDDIDTILTALARHQGLGLFLLSITRHWHLDPADARDAALGRAFAEHQRREGGLGAAGAESLIATARSRGLRETHSASPWHLHGPRDRVFIDRFLTGRVADAVEMDPGLEQAGADWLRTRLRQAQEHLTVTVDHTDVLVDARRSG